MAGAGKTYTAALGISGGNPGGSPLVESFNGTSWTEIADVNAGRDYGAGTGTTTSALFFGGEPSLTSTELWNGSSWTETTDLSTGRQAAANAGADNTNALYAGGPPALTATEEWTGAGAPVVQTFTDS